jgi:DNA-directed RNA polymerase subunit M/transcription elongation factor TFIIS
MVDLRMFFVYYNNRTMTTLKCQRCGYEAKTEAKLLKHWKTMLQCPALYSKVIHQNLIDELRPKPSPEQRTCPHCHNEFKSVTGMKNHSNKCKANIVNVGTVEDNASTSTPDITSRDSGEKKQERPKSMTELRKKKTVSSTYSTVASPPYLHSFDHDIDWASLQIEQQHILELCRKKAEGIIDLFIELHSCEKHDNIQWYYDDVRCQHKLIVFDGKKWTDINHKHLTQHFWYIFSYLEEQWCDYQTAIRCNALDSKQVIPETEQVDIEEFFYDVIVDEESVFFHCKDMFNEYIEAIKTI